MGKGETEPLDGITWRDGNLPVSRRFDDAYFAYLDGRAETAEVFLAGNDLPRRWHAGGGLRVGELGFGTGLNVFETVRTWQKACAENRAFGTLVITSFEQYPMTAAEMACALKRWPDVAAVAAPVLAAWADLGDDAGSFVFSGENWRAEVLFGDANARLAGWSGTADAWYLDGFSPAKNPELWNEALLRTVARKTAVGGTFSTYTAAGYVRRGLTAAGFECVRVPGFGGKRERLQGQLKQHAAD